MLPPPGLGHLGADHLAAQEGPGHIDIQGALPLIQRIVLETRPFQRGGRVLEFIVDRGVVHQDVDPSVWSITASARARIESGR